MSAIGTEEPIENNAVGGRLAGVQLTIFGKYRIAAVTDHRWVLAIRGSVGVAPYRVPCEREYLFGGGDCHPANALSCGRWISTLSG
jgi:hypothetical protein